MRHAGILIRRAGAVALALGLAAGALGCSDDDVPGPGPGATVGRRETLVDGDYAVSIDTGPREVTLTRAGEVLLRFPADAFQLGTLETVDDDTNYDAYRLYVPHPLYVPLDVVWLDPSAIAIDAVGPTALSATLVYGADGATRATLRIELGSVATPGARPGSFRAQLVPEAGGAPVAFFRLRPRAEAAEGFYGLGEYFDDVNHRGKVRAMQIELMPEIESAYNEAHVPVPLLLGTRGWGLFVESAHPGAFAVAVATSEPDLVEAAFGTGTASSDGLSFHLFAAPKAIDVTRHYYDVTGYPRLPAPWALGPWVWRDENDDQAQVEADLDAIRDLDLATTALWIDRPYATAVHTFDFDPPRFPTAQAMIDKMHALGFRTALWHTPYLDEMDQADATADLRAEAEAGGYWPPDTGILLNKWGRPIDLTNEAAVEWWKSLVGKYTAMGVEGFKLDYGEDVVLGVASLREPWLFADGSDERTMHARFQLFYHRLYADLLPADGGFLLCRGGTFGDQVNVSVIWPGDLDATFARHLEHVDDGGGGYVGVGGLPASVVAGLSLGPSGFPFFGADTGGYKHSPPDKELFTRWFQQTALSTVMQIGTSSNDVAWEPTPENGFDEEMLGWYRTYTRLHLRLFPYLWTHAQRIADDGRPIQRALGLAHPELGVHPNDVYLFGDALLVAPVVDRGVTSRTVPLPAGRWVDWWTGEVHEGGGEVTLDAPLERLPLLLAAGGIVPLLRPTIDTLSPTTEPDRVDSYDTDHGTLWVRLFAAEPAAFTLFDGAELAAEDDGATLRMSVAPGSDFTDGVVFQALAFAAAPAEVADGGGPLEEHVSLAAMEAAESGWFWDAASGGSLYVRVGPGAQEIVVTR